MSRSGYIEDYDSAVSPELYRQAVACAIRGKRGQDLLHAIAKELDTMPVKRLIRGDLITPEGECCTMGVIFKARGIPTEELEGGCPREVAKLLNIAPAMAAEIAWENDDAFYGDETPEHRWDRMRGWVAAQLKAKAGEAPK